MFARYYRRPAGGDRRAGGEDRRAAALSTTRKEVGADRIVNTLAAHHLYGGPAIVVDFGTSTNFDVVSAKGEFLGGALAPGIEISIDALAARARGCSRSSWPGRGR